VILVDLDDVAVARPGKPLFSHCSLTVSSGDRIGVVGINGTGKSTLLRVLAGTDEPESGTVRRGRGGRVAMLDQRAPLPEGTVASVVEDVAGDRPWEAGAVLDRLGMGELGDRPTDRLSGGQAKRVALARTLVAEAELLILDEPTNHLDIDSIAWLEDRLADHKGGLVLVTHDRHLLDRLTNRILELDRGRTYVHEGGYDAFLEGRATREEHAEAAEANRRNLARSELAWLRRGAPARTRKSKAHVTRARAVVEARPQEAARSAPLDLTAVSVAGGTEAKGWAATRHADTPRLGDVVVEAHGVGHRWGDGPWLFRHLDLLLDPRERLGVVGPNGGGKSTLADVLVGRLAPAEGRVVHGPTARIGYYDQLGVTLDPEARVREVVAGPNRQPDWRDAALLEQFWFGTDAQWAPVGLLSGGERRRLQLLLTLAAHPNVLVLDEPTNDLDLDTLRLLEEFLDDWPGALVVVSHDRAFLERTVTDVVVLDGTDRPVRRPGGFAAWEEERHLRRPRGRVAPSPASATRAGTPAGPGPNAAPPPTGTDAAPSTRSPSTLRHLVREVDKELARLERRRDALGAEVTAAGEDHEALARLGAELTEVDAALREAEERWLALAEESERAVAERRAGRDA
jgi:ATP-binding cassette subfamily F protein uup